MFVSILHNTQEEALAEVPWPFFYLNRLKQWKTVITSCGVDSRQVIQTWLKLFKNVKH
jgi:hypothetical protein